MQLHGGAPALQSHHQAGQGVQFPVAAAGKQPHPFLQQDRPRAADSFLDGDNHKDLGNDKETTLQMYKNSEERQRGVRAYIVSKEDKHKTEVLYNYMTSINSIE